jgi:threonine/homoserine/homoserine lactone efflux protein
MTLSLLISVAVFSFVTSVSPGPNNTFLLSSGANFGLRKSVPYLNGIMVGLAAMMIALGAGLGVIFTTLPAVYQVLKWVGFAYIVWLAYLIVKSTSKSDTAEAKYIGFAKSTTFQSLFA